MVTTVGPERESIEPMQEWMTRRLRHYPQLRALEPVAPPPDVVEYEPDPDPEPVRRARDWPGAAQAAILSATGEALDLATLDADDSDIFGPVLTEQPASAPQPEPERVSEPGAYKVRQSAFRAERGISERSRDKIAPANTPEGRRERHIRAKAIKLNISYSDAERMTPRRERR